MTEQQFWTPVVLNGFRIAGEPVPPNKCGLYAIIQDEYAYPCFKHMINCMYPQLLNRVSFLRSAYSFYYSQV